jgi:hypothetical protein
MHLKIINQNLYLMKKKILLLAATLLIGLASAFAQFDVTVVPRPPEGGYVTGGGVNIPYGTVMTVCAYPNSCYHFLYWSVNSVIFCYDICYTFSVTQSINLVANFAPYPVESVVIDGPTVVCDDNPIALIAFTSPSVPSGDITYQWYMNGVAIPLANTYIFFPYLEPSPNPYCFTVTVTENVTGCTVMSPMHCIFVNVPPMIAITADKTEIDPGEIVTLTANINQSPDMIYQWYANEDPVSGANAPVYYASPTTTTTYTFTATQVASGCTASSNEVTVIVNGNPILEIEGPDFLCGEDVVTLQAVTNPPLTNATYQWYLNGIAVAGASEEMLTMNLPPNPIPYCFIVIANLESAPNFLFSIHLVNVEENSAITITSDKTDIDAGEIVELKANVSGLFNRIYKWFKNGVFIQGSNSPIIYVSPTATTTYTFTATSFHSDECVSESNEITIIVNEGSGSPIYDFDKNSNAVIFYPNPSTGKFTVTGEKIIESIELYDALGKKVFTDTPNAKITQINTVLSNGLYSYRVTLKDNSICTGKIIIQ